MKIHEENKINALLNKLQFTEDEASRIIEAVADKNVGEDELIELMDNLNNWED